VLERGRRSRDRGIRARRVGARDVRERLTGDGRANLEIALGQGAAIEAEPVENIVDCGYGAPPSERRQWPGEPDRAMRGSAMLGLLRM
jgi:hypothetical protein